MGMRTGTIIYCLNMIEQAGLKFRGLKMCELGNQHIKDSYEGFKIAKDFFKSLGVNHTSIDWNGKDGSLDINMNEEVFIGKFDVVTNYGFTEHVENHKQCWNNIDNMLDGGGLVINVLPLEGNWEGHGLRKYNKDFFLNFVMNNFYKLVDYRIFKHPINKNRDNVLCTIEKK